MKLSFGISDAYVRQVAKQAWLQGLAFYYFPSLMAAFYSSEADFKQSLIKSISLVSAIKGTSYDSIYSISRAESGSDFKAGQMCS